MEVNKQWMVVYTKPRWEKKISQLLISQGIENYCPTTLVLRRWSDRMKKVTVPLFASYVFVHVQESEKAIVRETPGVLNYIYSEGKPAIVKDIEVERIKNFLADYDNVLVENGLQVDQEVQIARGLFIEQEGQIIDLKNNKAKVSIQSLGYTLVAVFDKSKLVPHTNTKKQ